MDEPVEWFWCLEHQRAEPRHGCRAERRLGPYPTAEAAAEWQQRRDAREDRWDADDEAWEGR